MNPKKSSLVLSLLFGAAFFLPADSMLGQSCAPNCVVAQGVDLFKTAAIAGATVADFSNQPLPMDFFCPGSAIFSGQIPLQGVPIVTSSPTTGGADTIIARLTDADLTNGTATVPIEVVALQLEQIAPLQISCSGGSTSWNVSVCLCEDQPTSEIDLTVTDPNGGEFSGTFRALVSIGFTEVNTGTKLGPINENIELIIDREPFSFQASNVATILAGAAIDTNCDGNPDIDLSQGSTSNFIAGLTPGTPDCITNPPMGCHEAPGNDHQHCPGTACVKPGVAADSAQSSNAEPATGGCSVCLFDSIIFWDGFESGDTSAWSSTNP